MPLHHLVTRKGKEGRGGEGEGPWGKCVLMMEKDRKTGKPGTKPQ